MREQLFFIKGRKFSAADPDLQDALARIYDTPERPRCMCRPGGIEMYVAKFAQYIIKRMPDTGNQHHPACPSYEPEWEQSGIGDLIGEAVIEHSPESIEVRVDFPLSRIPGCAVPRGESKVPGEINVPRRQMSLRALLHLLWEQARFNRWYPAMQGKRSWAVIRKYLQEAAAYIQIKGVRLPERLYMPEPFNEPQKWEIAERRRVHLAQLHSPESGAQFKMAIIVGEFKAAETSPCGRKVWIKHMPDCPLFIDGKSWERIERVFAPMFEARDADTKIKLRMILCAVIYAKREHTYQINTVSFMLVTDNWIPVEGVHEIDLIHRLIEQSRSFMKPLRYDAKSAAHFPNVLLLDAGDAPAALHVVSNFMDEKERAAKERALQRGDANAWVWHTNQPMPALPPMPQVSDASQP
jgi:hypothetical protein